MQTTTRRFLKLIRQVFNLSVWLCLLDDVIGSIDDRSFLNEGGFDVKVLSANKIPK